MEFFLKYQKLILRVVGVVMLLIGFVVHFWITPKIVVSKSDIAAANVARMEASVAGAVTKSTKPDPRTIAKALKATKEKQMEYLTLFSMLFGILFLLYSFFKKEES